MNPQKETTDTIQKDACKRLMEAINDFHATYLNAESKFEEEKKEGKFKVGDYVFCVAGYKDRLTVGKIYKINKAYLADFTDFQDEQGVRVTENNERKDAEWRSGRFRLATAEEISQYIKNEEEVAAQQQMIKVGDYVSALEGIWVGGDQNKIFKVDNVDDDYYYIKTSYGSCLGGWYKYKFTKSTKEEITNYLMDCAIDKGYVFGTSVRGSLGAGIINKIYVVFEPTYFNFAIQEEVKKVGGPIVVAQYGEGKDWVHPISQLKIIHSEPSITVCLWGTNFVAEINEGFVQFGVDQFSNAQIRHAKDFLNLSLMEENLYMTQPFSSIKIGHADFSLDVLKRLVKVLKD